MDSLKGKSILVIYNPWIAFQGSLHSTLINGLKDLKMDVSFLDIENPPKFENKNLIDKIRNIFERNFKNNKQYILVAEKKHYNRFFYTRLLELKKQKKSYDFVLIIKPEEYSEKFIRTASQMGNKTIGYIWDGLRLFFKSSLDKSRKYLDHLYSFDKNNIKDFPELKMEFLTNYYISDKHILPFEDRKIDIFYIGAIAGTLPSQRRDWKIANIIKYLMGNIDIKIFVDKAFLEKDQNLKKEINYTTEFSSISDTLEKTKNSKIVIDICKAHHIGLSFRFFECLLYETKLITNNTDIVNYDFYHPNNILIVDFDNIDKYSQQIVEFQKKPYHKIDEAIKQKYSLENWVKTAFKIHSK